MNPFPPLLSDVPLLNPSRISYGEVRAEDFEELLELRTAATKECLKRAGRYDPQRLRERLAGSFHPLHSQFILLDAGRVGFYTFRPMEDGFQMDHLYLLPLCQGLGIGSHVISGLIQHAMAHRQPIRLRAPRTNQVKAFYERHGFEVTAEEEQSIHYVRAAG